jgi:hypothetical protein
LLRELYRLAYCEERVKIKRNSPNYLKLISIMKLITISFNCYCHTILIEHKEYRDFVDTDHGSPNSAQRANSFSVHQLARAMLTTTSVQARPTPALQSPPIGQRREARPASQPLPGLNKINTASNQHALRFHTLVI